MKKTDFVALVVALLFLTTLAAAEEKAPETAPKIKGAPIGRSQQPVELTGDNVEYKGDEGKFVASGNVVLRQEDSTLFCDKLEFYRDRKEAHADGKVILVTSKGTIWADKGFFNFETKKGEFTNARIMAAPFYGQAVTVSKVGENYYVMSDGFFSTSDYDDPEWRVKARQIDVYTGDRAIAHSATMYVGGLPLLYAPRYTKSLEKNDVHISLIPGYKKEFGAYLLTSARTNPLHGVETTYHIDYRELRYLAGGADVKYGPYSTGQGLVRTYYMDERITHASRGWEKSRLPTDVAERYRVEWRHQWAINPTTSFIGQYYLLSDPDVVKTYFEREYRQDEGPATYALLTKTFSNATASIRTDLKVNRFDTAVQRLPEVNWTFNNQPIGDTGFYFKSANTASNLLQKEAAPSGNKHHTVRLDSDNEVSRPFKAAFLEFRPFVGTEHTYYSRALDKEDDNAIRGIFRTGTDVSTKFYRVYDVTFDKYGIEINRLRHIINPTVAYLYAHDPTLSSAKIYQYDGIDSRLQTDQAVLGIGNTLQTKRDGKSEDLFRSVFSSPYLFNDNVNGGLAGRLGDLSMTNELSPNKFVSIHEDASYNNKGHHIQTSNIDVELKDTKRWDLIVGKRYTYHDDDQLTTQLTYKFNPKWRATLYERLNLDNGQWREEGYSMTRDLHSWEVEMSIRTTYHQDGAGNEFMVTFRLKGFKTVSVGGSSSMSRAQPGQRAGSN